jgi:hypothetical protein
LVAVEDCFTGGGLPGGLGRGGRDAFAEGVKMVELVEMGAGSVDEAAGVDVEAETEAEVGAGAGEAS